MIINILSTIIAANAVGKVQQNNNRILNHQNLISEACVATAESMGLENLDDSQHAVKDLNGNIFVIQESFNGGFMIYDPIVDEAIETIPFAECPYIFDSNHDNYYFGPMNYYYRVDDTFYHYINSSLSSDLKTCLLIQENFELQLSSFRGVTSDESYDENNNNVNAVEPPLKRQTSGNRHYIDNYVYIRDENHPDNYDNSCGFIAASIILNYYDKTVHDGIVAPNFKDPITGELNNTRSYNPSVNLKDKLVEYNNGVRDSVASSVLSAVNKYCQDYSVYCTMSWELGRIGLDQTLEEGRPAILFGYFPNVQVGQNEYVGHAVVCYGYEMTNNCIGHYIVNYGWGPNYAEAFLGPGFVGENYRLKLHMASYTQGYTIKPSDFNFPNSYCSTKTTQTVNCGELSFETKRLRCGYIEDEYINLSPRKNGFDTAYLEMKFKNPIYFLIVDISFWSKDERYNAPNRASALIQYKKLRCTKDTDWIDSRNLLEDSLKLSTDRNKQTKLIIIFPVKTREIRFYTHFDYISGQNDRNKGRISIGDISIGTYC